MLDNAVDEENINREDYAMLVAKDIKFEVIPNA
jgi:hypothetical protein